MAIDMRAVRRAGLALLSPAILACASSEPQILSGQAEAARSPSARMGGATMSRGMMRGGMMRGGMMGGGMMGASMGEMRVIRGLLTAPDRIRRTVENVPDGVLAVTTSDDPRVTELIRTHVRQMKASYRRGEPIRTADPLFRELFANRDRITLSIEDVPGGVRVRHTSGDPELVPLIRQHARHFVSEAAEQGMSRAMKPTPLPPGYDGP